MPIAAERYNLLSENNKVQDETLKFNPWSLEVTFSQITQNLFNFVLVAKASIARYPLFLLIIQKYLDKHSELVRVEFCISEESLIETLELSRDARGVGQTMGWNSQLM